MKRPITSVSHTPGDVAEPSTATLDVHEAPEAPVGHRVVSGPRERGERSFPIVGIGASAGGLSAFEAFFGGMPEDWVPNMAFVLVQHLAPDHPSLLPELIARYTHLPVREIEAGLSVQPNCVYVVAPGQEVNLESGDFQLIERSERPHKPIAVDHFFQSLAHDRGALAVGIVLSGNGSDGTLGLSAIRAAGGMTFAQIPATAAFEGMPSSAVEAGVVDIQLAPEFMLPELRRRQGGFDAGESPSEGAEAFDRAFEDRVGSLKKLFSLVRARTGHDFSQYKSGTVHRRIERRMGVHRLRTLAHYLDLLQRTPEEVEALYQDFLIGVTQFFRDPEVFQYLSEKIIPRLFAGKSPGSVIRLWVAGCSTGEEAYSIAILIAEHLDTLQEHYTAQIFATDIDPIALATARVGMYPLTISRDVESHRLTRAFNLEADKKSYRIRKRIRDLLIFSEQDVNRDPPFSQLDFVSCRNLLIYLGGELQARVIRLFHYALKPEGMLLLGTSEGIGDAEAQFRTLERRLKVFERLPEPAGAARGRPRVPRVSPAAAGLRAQVGRSAEPTQSTPNGGRLRELAERALLHEWAPSAAVVNARGELLYLHGRTGLFLEPHPGEAGTHNILEMAREGLKDELAVALHQSATTKNVTRRPGLLVRSNGHFTSTSLTVCPIQGTAGAKVPTEVDLFLVILEDGSGRSAPIRTDPRPPDGGGDGAASGEDAQLEALRRELRVKEVLFRDAREQLESSGEELRSANEEMQSVNEELQSTNEELETSKEELQSVNEEFATVNSELEAKLRDLSRANNDMNNLLAGTGIGTVFVDHALRILRFTPAVSAIINLIASDVGRPVAHIASNLVGYSRLVEDTQAVLDTLVPREFEVETVVGRWYSARIQPYRTLDNVIEGAVISFVDITETVRTRLELARLSLLSRLAAVARDSRDAQTVQSTNGATLAWNPGAMRLYGWSEAEGLKLQLRDRMKPGLWQEELEKLRQLASEPSLSVHHSQRLDKSGNVLDMQIIVTALVDSDGCLYGLATTERPVVPVAAPAADSGR